MARKEEIQPARPDESMPDKEEGLSIRDSIRDKAKSRLSQNPDYKDYVRLVADDDLWELMQIPFSSELAELTRQTIVAPEPAAKVAAAPASKDEIIIKETIASILKKSPSELTASDYSKVTELNLSYSGVKNIGPLKALISLQILWLSNTQVSDIELLKALINLQKLWLYNTQVSDKQVAELKQALPELTIHR